MLAHCGFRFWLEIEHLGGIFLIQIAQKFKISILHLIQGIQVLINLVAFLFPAGHCQTQLDKKSQNQLTPEPDHVTYHEFYKYLMVVYQKYLDDIMKLDRFDQRPLVVPRSNIRIKSNAKFYISFILFRNKRLMLDEMTQGAFTNTQQPLRGEGVFPNVYFTL